MGWNEGRVEKGEGWRTGNVLAEPTPSSRSSSGPRSPAAPFSQAGSSGHAPGRGACFSHRQSPVCKQTLGSLHPPTQQMAPQLRCRVPPSPLIRGAAGQVASPSDRAPRNTVPPPSTLWRLERGSMSRGASGVGLFKFLMGIHSFNCINNL